MNDILNVYVYNAWDDIDPLDHWLFYIPIANAYPFDDLTNPLLFTSADAVYDVNDIVSLFPPHFKSVFFLLLQTPPATHVM